MKKGWSGIRLGMAVACVLLACTPLATRADAAADAAREAERIQREQQQRIEQEQRALRERGPHSGIDIPLPQAPVPDPAAPDTCRDIHEILIDGAHRLSERTQQRLIAPYLGQCLTVTDIERLLSELTAAYVRRGYITARVYIPAQDLSTGVLRLLVVEGELESLTRAEGDAHSLNLSTAFPGLVGAPLNLRDIEQGLEQINRLPSNNATLDLRPGVAPGGSAVVIHNQTSRRLRGNVTYDNYGSSSTGRNQAGATVSLDHPLRLNDSLMLSYRQTTGDDFRGQHSRSWSTFYSVPMGYVTFTGAWSKSDYATTLELTGGDLIADGDQENISLTTDYVAYRDATNRLSFSGTLTSKEARNYLAGELLDVSSRRLSTFDLGASWSTSLAGGAFSARAGHAWGLTWFGALEDESGRPAALPQAQFRKWSASLNWMRTFSVLGQFFTFSSQLEGQDSADVLYGSEQFSIGSLYNVRGYRDNSLSGDRGYYWRNELSRPASLTVRDVRINLRPYVGFDTGEILDHRGMQGGHLSSVSLGMSAYTRLFALDVVATEPVAMPEYLEDEGFQAFAKFTVTL